jgi:oxaloacetate decarboxylase (Na+ extruding) subunit gamma
MFGQSGVLALLGMGVVFLFLFILVLTVSLVARVVRIFKWDSDLLIASEGAGLQSADHADDVAAAITAAVQAYRSDSGEGAAKGAEK